MRSQLSGHLPTPWIKWRTRLGGEKTLKEIDKTANLITSMQELGRTLDENLANLESSFDWVDPVLNALNASPICQFDPACRDTRRELQAWAAARGNGTFEKIAEVADQLQSTQEAQTLELNGHRSAQSAHRRHQRLAVVGIGQTRRPAKADWPTCNPAPIPLPMRARSWPTACSNSSTKPNRWV